MPQLSLAVKPFTVTQGSLFKLSSALFSVGAADYSLSISVLGGSLFNNGVAIGVPSSFTLAELKLGKISFLADGTSLPSFYFQASANGFANSAETQPILVYKAVNQAPVVSIPGLGSNGDALLKGGTITITRDMINASDAETPDAGNLKVKITTVKGGSFLLNGFAAKSFSLADVDNGSVSFKHDGKLLAPSFSLSVSDSDGKASSVKSTNSATVVFDGSQTAESLPSNPHEIAVKAPLSITEGATLKLTAKNLPIAVSTDVVPLLEQPTLELRIDTADHCTVMVSGSSVEFFTLAQLKAGLVSLLHDGSQVAPKLELTLVNGDTEIDSLSLPFAFKTTNDLPTLRLNSIVLNPGQTKFLDLAHFNVADEETPEPLEGAYLFTVRSSAGIVFHRSGHDTAIKTFSHADVDAGLISITRLSNFVGSPTYALSVTDPMGKASVSASGPILTNHAPQGSVSISGVFSEDQILTASNTLLDSDALGTINYTWMDASNNVLGNGADLTLTQALVGKQIKLVASYVDGQGTQETKASALSAAISNVNDALTGSVTLAGNATQGQTLTASHSLSDIDGLGAISYTWKDNLGNALGNDSSLILTQAHVGKQIKVVANYTDGQGTAESAASGFTGAVANVNDAPSGAVTITGSAVQGQTLTASAASLADADVLGSLSYLWQDQDGTTLGSSSAIALTQSHVGKQIKVVVSYVDGQGTQETRASAFSDAISNVNDIPTGSVTLTGNATQGQTLTASHSLADIDGLGAITYTWKDSLGNTLDNGSTLLLTQAHVGKQFKVVASYTDGQETAESAASGFTSAVANVNDAPSGAVTITGSAVQGQALTASAASLADVDGLGSLSYLWQDQDGATLGSSSSLVLTQTHVGKQIKVVVSYTDGGGFAESMNSFLSSAVANVNDAASGIVTISGVFTKGQILTASNSLADVDGLGSISYTWKDADGNTIGTGITFTLAQGHVGKIITVTASYIDQHGTAEALVSSPTVAIAPPTTFSEVHFAAVGPDFVVNAIGASDYDLTSGPAVIVAGDGSFIVAWKGQNPDHGSYDIFARRYGNDGVALADDFVVSTSGGIDGDQSSPSVSSASDGSFIVTWRSYNQANDITDILARRFGNDGVALGNYFVVNTTVMTGNHELSPALSMAEDGSFIVIWSAYDQSIGSTDILARRFGSEGVALGDHFVVNSTVMSGNEQSSPTLSMAEDGSFIVTWSGQNPDNGSTDIFVRRFDEVGVAIGADFVVNTTGVSDHYQSSPAVGLADDGSFIITWTGDGPTKAGTDIFARRYGSDGVAIGDDFVVNTTIVDGYNQANPAVSVAEDGSFMVTWHGKNPANGSDDIFARRFGSDGEALGNDIVVNTTGLSSYDQFSPASGVAEDGEYIITWGGGNPDSGSWAIFARRFEMEEMPVESVSHEIVDTAAVDDFSLVSGRWTSSEDGWIFSGTDIGRYGDLMVNIDGAYTYTPDSTKINLLPSGSFRESFSINASKGELSESFDLLVNIQGANDIDFVVNTTGLSDYTQASPALSVAEDGSFIVSWSGQNAAHGTSDIFARRYGSDGVVIGDDFMVNMMSGSGHDQSSPAVSVAGNGNFIVTWRGDNIDTNSGDILARRFGSDGVAFGDDFIVNTTGVNGYYQFSPALSIAGDGGFIVTWSGKNPANDSEDIFARRYGSDGVALGDDFVVNTTGLSDYTQASPALSVAEDGSFIVSWQGKNPANGTLDIFARRFDNDGVALGDDFVVNTTGVNAYQQLNPDLSMAGDGSFIVTWSGQNPANGTTDIFARRFDEDGVAIGADFVVNTTGVNGHYQSSPSLNVADDGSFIITWTGGSPTNDSKDIFARRYGSDGVAIGDDFVVNATGVNGYNQFISAVNLLGDGSFIVTWAGENPANGSSDIFATRFNAAGTPISNSKQSGVSAAETLTGSAGAYDLITDISSGDTALGLAGNDTFQFTTSDFALIDGGNGTDTIKISTNWDLTLIPNDRLTNIEVINLGSSAVNLKMELADVLALSGGTGSVKVIGTNALGNWDKEAGWSWVELANGFEKYTNGDATVYLQTELGVI